MKRKKRDGDEEDKRLTGRPVNIFLHAFKEELGDETKDADEEKEQLEMLASKQL